MLPDVTDINEALTGFSGANKIPDSLKSGVALAARTGIIAGLGNQKFDPSSSSTRAQTPIAIYRLINLN